MPVKAGHRRDHHGDHVAGLLDYDTMAPPPPP
jgi:hypothetical protein